MSARAEAAAGFGGKPRNRVSLPRLPPGPVEPRLVFERTALAIAEVLQRLRHIGKPSVLAGVGGQPVAFLQRARHLRRIAQAQHDLWREPELREDLMPQWQEP